MEKREDQLAVHDYIYKKTLNRAYADIEVLLDKKCLIFQTSHLTEFSMGDWNLPNNDGFGPYIKSDGVILNSETNSTPLFLHFNGIKFFLPQVFRSLESNSTLLINTVNPLTRDGLNVSCNYYNQTYSRLLYDCSLHNVFMCLENK